MEGDVYDEDDNEVDELAQLKEQETLIRAQGSGQDWNRPEWAGIAHVSTIRL